MGGTPLCFAREGPGVVALDCDVTSSEYANLQCVASGCRNCGCELWNAVRPRGNNPFLSLHQQYGEFLTFTQPSMVVLSFLFASPEERFSCWLAIADRVEVPFEAYWSLECRAGLPWSEAVGDDRRSQQQRLEDDHRIREQYGTGKCAMVLKPQLVQPFVGVWSDQVAALYLQRLLGVWERPLWEEVIGTVVEQACEFVPLVDVPQWEAGRERVFAGVSGKLPKQHVCVQGSAVYGVDEVEESDEIWDKPHGSRVSVV